MGNGREVDGKFRQFNRVLMSYVDFQQAHSIASIILDENLHENYPRKNRILLEALNFAMVVAYCRPFSGNKGVPDLPKRFVRNLSKNEKEIHDALIEDRNKVIAHSDSEAWDLQPHYQIINERRMLVPFHKGVHRPFLLDPTIRIRDLAKKQMDTCFEERVKLEKELESFIPVETCEED